MTRSHSSNSIASLHSVQALLSAYAATCLATLHGLQRAVSCLRGAAAGSATYVRTESMAAFMSNSTAR